MVNCLIVDDEPLARQVLENYIGQTTGLQLIKSCLNALDALATLRRCQVDLLLLDIQLPSLTGIELLRSLKEPPAVIFTTAYAEYAVESYELEAVDYLLKPITYERFSQALSKYLRQTTEQAPAVPHTYFKINGQLRKLLHADIIYVQSLKDYLLIKTTGGNHITHMTMKTLTELLPTPLFRRVHRSFLINVSYMTVLGKQQIELGDVKIPVGEQYRMAIREQFIP